MQMTWLRRMSLVILVLLSALTLAACGGVSDTTVPPPPNGTEVKTGDDAITDTMIQTMNDTLQSTASSENFKIDKTTSYTSTSSPKEVADFYKTEMKNRGWNETDSQEVAGAYILGYDSGNNGVLIMAFDQTTIGGNGTLVMTMNLSK